MARLSFAQLFDFYYHAVKAIDALDELNIWKQINLREGLLRDTEAANSQAEGLMRVIAGKTIEEPGANDYENVLVCKLYLADLEEQGSRWEFACYEKDFLSLREEAEQAVQRLSEYEDY